MNNRGYVLVVGLLVRDQVESTVVVTNLIHRIPEDFTRDVITQTAIAFKLFLVE